MSATSPTRAVPGARLLAVPATVLLAGALVGCSAEGIDPPEPEALSSAEAAACTAFLDDLPDGVDADSLTCGAPEPATLEATSECDEVRGIGWFVDPDAFADPDSPLVATAIGVRPRVAVAFTAEQRGQVSLEVLSALADPISEHLETVSRCR